MWSFQKMNHHALFSGHIKMKGKFMYICCIIYMKILDFRIKKQITSLATLLNYMYKYMIDFILCFKLINGKIVNATIWFLMGLSWKRLGAPATVAVPALNLCIDYSSCRNFVENWVNWIVEKLLFPLKLQPASLHFL